jgi:hypothetical protein
MAMTKVYLHIGTGRLQLGAARGAAYCLYFGAPPRFGEAWIPRDPAASHSIALNCSLQLKFDTSGDFSSSN